MTRELIVTGLDNVIFEGDGLLRGMYKGIYSYGFLEGYPAPRRKSNMIKHIGQAITGRTVKSIEPLVSRVSSRTVSRVNHRALKRLNDFPPSSHEIVAMSSAPDFLVRKALDLLMSQTGTLFSNAHILASSFVIEDGCYTGEYQLLDKPKAIAGLLRDVGTSTIKLGLIDSEAELEWAREHCEAIETFTPKFKLARHLENLDVAST
ncbi:MAG TPA: hypothetical protein VMR76_00425 [Candidatus Saccharimonadia bacterium]|nr:hypothetical protein [Candidatus Saccharimonadia bacterium]